MVKRVLVLGGGTAGLIAAISVKTKAPWIEVTVLRSVQIGVIGVGEGTTSPVPNYLHYDLKIPPGEFCRRARPTYKLGLKLFWGPMPYFYYPFRAQFNGRYTGLDHDNGYYCDETMEYASIDAGLMTHNLLFERQDNGLPMVPQGNYGYHVENTRFVGYLENYAASIGVVLVDEKVANVEQGEAGIGGLTCVSGRRFDADLYIDSSGFVSLLLGKTLQEPFRSFGKSLYCDRAIAGGWKTTPDEVIEPYTTAETMNAGWSWRIDHEDCVNRGYVYSSAFITQEEAEREFRAKNPRVKETMLIKLVSGNYQRGWVKNVVGVGNAAGFVEPLEATSIGIICRQARAISLTLGERGLEITPEVRMAYNRWQNIRWDLIRNFLAIHYRFNTRLDTPFWRACRSDVDIGAAAEVVEFYRDCGPHAYWINSYVDGVQVYETEGYLTMLLGMKVPYRNRYVLTAEDRQRWEQKRANIRERAMKGVSVREATEVFRRPELTWPAGYFQPMN